MPSTPDDLLAQHTRQRQALEALRASIAALGEAAPPEPVAQETVLVAALAATEVALRAAGVRQITTSGGDVAGQDIDKRQGNFISGGEFHGDVIGKQEHIHITRTPDPMPLDQALRLLDQLPLDDIPAPQTLPQPHRMSFAANPLFVGRADSLREIAAQLKAGGTIAVTTGIGGVGKTQLAIEAAHRYGHFFGGGVFWLSFADASAIPTEVADCGRRIGAFHDTEKLDLEVQVQRTLARWASNLPRLLVFDNCEEEALLRQWRPKTGACRVLVTSRKQTAWSADLRVTLLPLEVLTRKESVRLLQQLAPRLSSEEAEQIAEELGDLPLALHLAGCYLKRYPVAVEGYLSKLRSPDLLAHASLIGRGVEGMPTDRQPNVERVFALSFERLDASNPIDNLARQLLARAACFAPGEPFDWWWLEATITPEGDKEEQQLAYTDAVERLLSLGLLEGMIEGLMWLHRLLAAYAASALNDTDALLSVEHVVNRLVHLVNNAGVPRRLQPLLPHLRHLVQQAEGREDAEAASLATNLGCYLNAVGAYPEARRLLEQVLDTTERVLGADHPQTAQSLNNLAGVCYEQGLFGEARPLLERALAIRERVLGADHPQTARSLNNLAGLLERQGLFGEARPLLERALDIAERVPGVDHPQIAASLNNLAALYQAQGASGEARPLLERALDIVEQVLGVNHPNIAFSLSNLASLVEAQGMFEEACSLMERALGISERALGADHPQTALILNNLAMLHINQGMFVQALPLLERATAIYQARLGVQHPDTVQAQQSLAELHWLKVIADSSEKVCTALQAQDDAAFQQAMRALTPEEALSIIRQIQAAGLLRDTLE